MSFYAPLWLLAGAAAILVILLHTLRRTQVEVPSVLLWRKLAGVAQARPVPRPPQLSWLLLLQVLAVLLLALALARPHWGGEPPAPAHRIYVLDASGSMSTRDAAAGQSRFEAAVAGISADIAAIDATADVRFSLITTGAGTRPVAARFDDRTAFAAALGAVPVSDGAADWAAVTPMLEGVTKTAEATSLWIYTDNANAVSGLVDAQAALQPQVWTAGASDTANSGLTATLEAGEKPGEWTVSGNIMLAGGATAEAFDMSFRPAGGSGFLDMGRARLRGTSQVSPDLAVARFSSTLKLPGPGTLKLALPDDAALFDNIYLLEVDAAATPMRVLYIGTGNRPVELALTVNPGVNLFSSQIFPGDVDSYDLVLIDNVAVPRVPRTNVVWLGSARGPDMAAPELTPASAVLAWNSEHVLARGISWQSVATLPAYGVAPMPGATRLLGTAAGPNIEARTMPWGREVRIALAIDGTTWVDGPQLPQLINRILDWTGAMPSARGECVVGTACTIPARLLSETVRDAAGQVVWSAPMGGGDTIPDGLSESFVPQRAGSYVLGKDHSFVVNAPASESAIAATPMSEVTAEAPSQVDLWRWVLVAALALLVLEAVLAVRGGERFLYPAALAKNVLGARRRRWLLAVRTLAIGAGVIALFAVAVPVFTRNADFVLVAQNPVPAACGWVGQQGSGQVTAAAAAHVMADIGCAEGVPETASAETINLEAAVQLAAAMVRPDSDGRVILAGYDTETAGNVAASLALLNARQLPLDLQAPGGEADPVAVTALHAPAPIFGGDKVPVTATLFSAAEATLDLQMLVDGAVVETRNVLLHAGRNPVNFVLPEMSAGDHLFEVAVIGGSGDAGNDRFGVAASILEAPMVAIVTPEAQWGDYFAQALAVHGLRTTVLRPDRAPFAIEGWLDYDSVVLLNTPAIDLSTQQQEQLEEYARVHGKGLLILGGENSFGPGGYFRTPLEDVSPLSARVPNDMPVAALSFVLDRSGSMQALVEGVTRLDIAKQATLSAIELLNDESQVSVVVFDTESHVLTPMEQKNMPRIEAALAPLQPGGGTFFMPALEQALVEMDKADAPVRHIVLMSDGLSQPGDYDTFATQANEAGITLSVVAIGAGANVGRLESIARSGGGSFHSTNDFRALPSILSQEAMMLAGEPMQAGVQPSIWADRAAGFLRALPEELPPIQGFVETTPKPDATVHMETINDKGDRVPLLASWTYGNGNVLAFATHGAGQGTAQWLAMESYPLLWSQAIRHFASGGTKGPQVAMSRHGDMVRIDVADSDAATVRITRDDAPFAEVALDLRADGSRSAQFLAQPGLYRAELGAGDGVVTGQLAVSYPARLNPDRAMPNLAAMAAATGGTVLAADAALPQPGLTVAMERAWRPWVVLTLMLFLLDLTMRYAPGYFGFLRDRRGPNKPVFDKA